MKTLIALMIVIATYGCYQWVKTLLTDFHNAKDKHE